MEDRLSRTVKKVFALDNPVMKASERVIDLLGLNLLFILSALPLVTVGVAKMSLYQCLEEVQEEGHIRIFSSYWKAFRLNFKRGISLGLIEMGISLVCLLDIWLISHQVGDYLQWLKVVFMAIFILNIAVFLYLYPLAVWEKIGLRKLFEQAFLLASLHLPQTFMLLGSLAAILVFLYSSALIFLVGMAFLLLVGFSVMGYAYMRIMEGIFEKYRN
ncbi:Predicted integral membrane protein [Chlamydia trachomatis]|nr:Predicted integral membrane protein [Chlamydia trachomatis]